MPDQFGITNIYPNPFNATTRIRYTLDIDGFVNISLFDLTGRELVSIEDNYRTTGTYRTNLDLSAYPSGLYMLKMTVGVRVDLKKLVCIK